MKAIIIEDEIQGAETLIYLLNKYCPDVQLAGTAQTFSEGHSLYLREQPELVFCDIQLSSDGVSGLDLIQLIQNKNTKVIFTTAWKEFAIDAFRLNAVDYLLKPISIEELTEAVSRAKTGRKTQDENQGALHIPTQHGFLIVPFADITRCLAEGSYTHFFLSGKGGKSTTSVNIGTVEEKLPPSMFFRVHKTHIVNKNYIAEYIRGENGSGGSIIMSDASEVPLSRLEREAFMKWLG